MARIQSHNVLLWVSAEPFTATLQTLGLTRVKCQVHDCGHKNGYARVPTAIPRGIRLHGFLAKKLVGIRDPDRITYVVQGRADDAKLNNSLC